MLEMGMDELVEKLRTCPKTRAQWAEVANKLDEKENKKNQKVYKVCQRVITGQGVRLNYEDGFSVHVLFSGGVLIEKNQKSISPVDAVVFNDFLETHTVDFHDMMFAISHMSQKHTEEVAATIAKAKLTATQNEKTRFIHSDRKRAFMAGLVCGRMPPEQPTL